MRIYTTGEVSKICKVATTTVNKWFDSGRLQGFRVPGSRHRRIPQTSLIKFLRDHGVPLGPLEDTWRSNVLLVTRDRELAKGLEANLPPEAGVRLVVTSSGFEAGIQAENVPPDCVIIDFDMGQAEALQMCQNLRRNPALGNTLVVALQWQEGGVGSALRPVADETFTKPLDPALLAQRTRRLLSDRQRSAAE